MKSPAVVAMFLLISIFTGVFLSCVKSGSPPSPEEIAKIVGQAIEAGLREAEADMGNGTPALKLVESKGNNFTYKEYSFGGGGYRDYFTIRYNGQTVEYCYNQKTPMEIYTIELEPDESRYIIPSKGATVIMLQYPDYIADYPQYFIHYKLSNNEVKFLEKVANTKDLGNNLYIHDSLNQSVMDIIKTVSDSARLDEEAAATTNFAFSFSAGHLLGVMEILLDGFNVDALPEKIYPVTDRNAEARLQKDINTSKVFGMLMSTTATEYINLAQLANTERSRRIQRLNSGLSSGNKSLFQKVFGADAKNLALKGFSE